MRLHGETREEVPAELGMLGIRPVKQLGRDSAAPGAGGLSSP
jgi:hypothetical protein